MRVLSACLLGLVMTAGAQVSNTLCDGIVGQIRSGAVSNDPFEVLYKGDHPSIELANRQEMQFVGTIDGAEKAEFVNRFLARFNPSAALRQAWTDFVELRSIEVLSLPDSDVHVATSTDGTAHCVSFLFFQRVTMQSELLPDLPRKSESDGDNLICTSYGSAGYLARIGGTESFLETYSQDSKQRLRVVPLRNRRWGTACSVDAEFRTEYKVSKVFVPGDGAVTEAQLRAVAAQIVEQHVAAKDPKTFTFGLPLAETERDGYRAMTDLVSKLKPEPVPTFGREGDLETGEEFLSYAESYPLVLGGNAYLMRLGHGQLGCCVYTDPALVLYTLKDGKLEAVASAFVSRTRGALENLRAIPSR